MNDIYFAADKPDIAVRFLDEKAKDWFTGVGDSSYLSKIERSWKAYYGDYYGEGENSHGISFGGENGELVNLAVNHYRNLARHIHVMVTGTRPAFQCRAINTDKKSLIQAKLGNGLLDYYMREMRLEEVLKQAVEYAIILGSGYVKLEWNSTKGKIYDYVEPDPSSIAEEDEDGNLLDEDGNILEPMPLYEGDVDYSLVSPYNVIFDSTKEYYDKNDWLVCRNAINRYDLAAKYPEYSRELLETDTVDKEQKGRSRRTYSKLDQTEDIFVKEFFHRRTASMPQGRYMLYVNDEIILEDTDLPYRDLPIFRITPSSIIGTPYGYTDMFDLLPLQEMLNSMYSTAATNINAFGVQSILVPRSAGLEAENFGGGMQFLHYNDTGKGKPEPMQLTATSPEVYQMMQILEKTMETLSGVNSVARGNPEQSLRSGNALALVQSQALQFVSGLQQSYVRLLEDVGTGTINLLKDFASAPRVVAIAGKSNTSEMKTFKSSDISSINRVIVESGNALMNCLEYGTEVVMYDGTYIKVEDIRKGDLLMGPDSLPRTVEVTGSGSEEMFEVRHKSKKNEHVYTCNRSHIMTLKYCSSDDRYGVKKGQEIDITVDDFLKLPKRQSRLLMGFRRGIEMEKKELPIDPYILGSWLGDGTSLETAITTEDFEVEEAWSDYADSIGMQMKVKGTKNTGNAKTYRVTSGIQNGRSDRNPMMNILRELELIGNKHVPHIYKYNDTESRLQLLAGFIDADGTTVSETFVINQKCNVISDGIEYIARSLGFKVGRSKVTRTTNKMKKEAEYNIISIGGDTWNIPTKIARKQIKKIEKQKDWRNYGIDLVSIGEGKYCGFSLVEDPHFLLKDFTVTHNSTAGRVQVAENLLQMGLIDNIDKYLMVLNTGNLDYLTDGKIDNLTLIKSENEAMVNGERQQAIWSERHSAHIKEHMEVLNDSELKKDAQLVQLVLDHVQEHANLLRTTDPVLLGFIGEQPIAPEQVPGQVPPPANPNQSAPVGDGNAAVAAPQDTGPDGLPTMPRPAGEGTILPDNLPTKPGDL